MSQHGQILQKKGRLWISMNLNIQVAIFAKCFFIFCHLFQFRRWVFYPAFPVPLGSSLCHVERNIKNILHVSHFSWQPSSGFFARTMLNFEVFSSLRWLNCVQRHKNVESAKLYKYWWGWSLCNWRQQGNGRSHQQGWVTGQREQTWRPGLQNVRPCHPRDAAGNGRVWREPPSPPLVSSGSPDYWGLLNPRCF